MSEEKEKVKIEVESKDPPREDEKEPKPPNTKYKDDNHGPIEESEEDKLLREKLESTAKKLFKAKKDDIKIFTIAVGTLAEEIKSATGSMTAVPKPLKFLRPFYEDLKGFYETHQHLPKDFLIQMADVLSVLAMTMAKAGSREMLNFKLQGNREELGEWGHEFVRALCGEISQEYASLDDSSSKSKRKELQMLSRNVVPFLIHQNTETEAVDLLFEVEDLDFLLESKFVDESNYERTCLYLTKFSEYLFQIEDLKKVLETAFELYLRCKDLPNALRVALKLADNDRVAAVFEAKFGDSPNEDECMKKQLGFILGSQKNFSYQSKENSVNECIDNEKLGRYFQILAQNLNLEEAKSPEDVYKTHLYDTSLQDANAQSTRKNLAQAYVNAFVNCGFEHDSLLNLKTPKPGETSWAYKHKERGKIAAVASLGMISLWSPNVGSNLLNEWLELGEDQIEAPLFAGGLLGLGLTSCGINGASEMSLALIQDALSNEDDPRKDQDITKVCAALGIGIGFAGNPNEEAMAFLTEMLADEEQSVAVRAFSSLAIGLIYVGTGDSAVASEISQHVFSFEDEELNNPLARFFLLGWALIYLGKQNLEDEAHRESMEAQLQGVTASEVTSLAHFGEVLLDVCRYAGSGNVIQVQKLLHLCAEHLDEDGLTQAEAEEKKQQEEDAQSKKNDDGNDDEEKEEAEQTPKEEEKAVDKEKAAKNGVRQSIAVLGLILITFGDSVGKQMAERSLNHLLQYGDLAIRRSVPLAMALSRISDPEYSQIDILSKLSHDTDKPTAMNAILALGLTAAGTTNSRVAQLLRQLAVFHKGDNNILLIVRMAQGLLFAGKGLVTLHPFHSDRTLMNPTAIAALMTVMVAALDLESSLLSDYHILLYTLAAALRPRMCITLVDNNGELEHVKVKVRVGEAVETVGQAGNPKTITGFQTQETPVLLNVGDRVELATDEFESYTSVLEGVVVLKRVEPKDDGQK